MILTILKINDINEWCELFLDQVGLSWAGKWSTRPDMHRPFRVTSATRRCLRLGCDALHGCRDWSRTSACAFRERYAAVTPTGNTGDESGGEERRCSVPGFTPGTV